MLTRHTVKYYHFVKTKRHYVDMVRPQANKKIAVT